MSTEIRPELSYKNKYAIPKHRYYELVHFCQQYDYWKGAYRRIAEGRYPLYEPVKVMDSSISNPVEQINIQMEEICKKIEMIERCAELAGDDLARYILMSVTHGMSYQTLRARLNIPCCRDVFYEKYHRFFYILDKVRK